MSLCGSLTSSKTFDVSLSSDKLGPSPPINSSAIADTGTTGHFLSTTAPTANKRPALCPLAVTLPNHEVMHSTHEAELHLPGLPPAACSAHLFPSLGDLSLVSIGQLCDAGCVATFTDTDVTVAKAGTTVLQGRRHPDKLWHVELPSPPQALAAVNQSTNPADLVAFAHAALFSPSISTLSTALRRNYVHFPGLTGELLNKHPPQSAPMIKGHLDQVRKNLQSTKSKLKSVFRPPPGLDDPDAAFTFPSSESPNDATHHCFAAVIETNPTGLIYTDQTGRFPTPSSLGNNYFFVLYDYDSNLIDAEPIPSRHAPSILKAYKRCVGTLTQAGLRPRLQRLDNECSDILKAYMTDIEVDYQLVPPGVHRRNAAERAIRTFKNHLIAGLCSVNPKFPLHLWDRLLPQCLLSLNLLRGSRINPKLSAWAQVHGHFDFDRTPIAPPGIQVLAHFKPGKRDSWAAHALDAWYVGPALESYRCYNCWIWSTKGERICDTVSWFPHATPMPLASSTDIIRAGIQDIVHALKHPSPDNSLAPLQPSTVAMLNQLTTVLLNIQPSKPVPLPRPSPRRVLFDPSIPRTTKCTLRSHSQHPARLLRVPTPVMVVPAEPASPAPEPSPKLPPPRRRRPTKSRSKKTAQRKRRRLSPNGPAQNTRASRGTFVTNSAHLASATAAWSKPDPVPADTTPSDHFAFQAVNPDSGELAEYAELIACSDGPEWLISSCEEWGRLAQGYKDIAGTNTIRFIKHTDMPRDRKATYVRIVCTDRPQKVQPRRVRHVVGGDRIDYPGDTRTKTSTVENVKILINSVLSTPGARMMCMDLKDFYLNTPMERKEYIRVHLSQIPKEIMDLYNLWDLVYKDHVYSEISRGMYGLPQAGRLANDELIPFLLDEGYYQLEHTPAMFRHPTRPIIFCLTVDDFGVQYVGKEHAQHLLSVLEKHYTVSVDWTGSLYCGITLDWDYDARTCDLSMPGYIARALQRFEHPAPARRQHSPHAWNKPIYGTAQQLTPVPDTSSPLPKAGIKRLQEIIGVLLFYARAVDSTMLVALSSLASAQASGTEATALAATRLLNYAATNPNAVLRFHASDMILHIDSDASYLSEPHARSRAGGFHYLSSHPKPNTKPPLNGAFHIVSNIMRNVMASATEAEVGALFFNAQTGAMFRTTLEEMGYPQPPTPIKTDNAAAEGIINDKVKQRRSKAIDMRFYWVRDRVRQGHFQIYWQPGSENHADYFTKHHSPAHHRSQRAIYLHEPALPPAAPPDT